MYENIYVLQKEYAAQNGVPVMTDEGIALLQTAVAAAAPAAILEIGTAIGYSGLRMLEAAPSGARLYTVELDAVRAEKAREYFRSAGVYDRVEIWEGDAAEVLAYAEGRFDFIMLDGPKGHYDRYFYDIDRLLKPGGVLFADNVSFKGKRHIEGTPEHKHRTIINSLNAFLQKVNGGDYFTVTLETGDGISLSVKKR